MVASEEADLHAPDQAERPSPLWALKARYQRLLAFFVVGGLNTLFGYGVYALMILVGLTVPVAIAVSTVAGVLFNFKTTSRLVFGNRDNSKIVRFVAAYLVTYMLNVGLAGLLVRAGLNSYLAGAAAILPMALVSYFILSRFVFRKP